MHHAFPLITTIAAAFGLALVLGFVAARMRLPTLVGYLLAGMLLMFGVGLHFSLDDLLCVRRIALPGAIVQMVVATAMGAAVATWWGWPAPAAIIFGLALSVASTVVLLKALESKGIVESVNGRIAIGWLVVEDLAMVIVLVLLPPLAGMAAPGGARVGAGLWIALGRTVLEVVAFVALMLIVGRRALPWLLWQVTRTGSSELFTLCVVAAAVTIAYGSAELFGVSFALGAFYAGMVLRTPLVFAASEPALRRIRARSALARKLDRSDDPLAELPMSTDTRFLKNQVVIVGYGRVGSAIGAALKERGIPFVVAEENREIVERLRGDGQAAVLGNAVEPETLVQAHIADARMLVVATPQTLEVRQMVETARALNPDVQVVVRSHNEEEAVLLEREQAGKVFVGEQELARAMTQHVLANVSAEAATP